MISVPDLRRLALIGDSVFAVSITLNARAVTIPKLGESGFGSAAFGTFVEGVISVLLSVVVACLFWLGHWRYFRHVRKSSVALIAAHFTFLLALILLPISTDLFATNRLNPVATLVYGLNLLLLAVVALIFRIVAVRHSPNRTLVAYDWIGLAGVIALFTLAVALSFQSPLYAQTCWYVGLGAPLFEAWLSRRIARQQPIAAP
jgi:uncharacterized membrane protein